jgi:hypothetical protein
MPKAKEYGRERPRVQTETLRERVETKPPRSGRRGRPHPTHSTSVIGFHPDVMAATATTNWTRLKGLVRTADSGSPARYWLAGLARPLTSRTGIQHPAARALVRTSGPLIRGMSESITATARPGLVISAFSAARPSVAVMMSYSLSRNRATRERIAGSSSATRAHGRIDKYHRGLGEWGG